MDNKQHDTNLHRQWNAELRQQNSMKCSLQDETDI